MALGPDGGLSTARLRSALAAPDSSIALIPFVSGLSAPVLITHAGDDSGRLFIVEQGGRIKIVKNGQVNGTPFLDISSLVVAGGEQGLLGLAFHPRYKDNGRFFAFYTAKPPPGAQCLRDPNNLSSNCGNNTLAEFAVTGNPDVANPTPVRVMVSLHDHFSNHNGGMIAFSPIDPSTS
jgi:glucose/arabinose dehydrogenase